MKCLRCDGEWTPRVFRPRYCPLCKSPAWNVPRVKDAPVIVEPITQDLARQVVEDLDSLESATISPARAKAPHPGGDPIPGWIDARVALKRPGHDPKTCRIYKCLQCAELRAPKAVK